MKHISPVVIAVIEKNGKYLLTHRSDHKRSSYNVWQFPGGKLEWGEEIETCLHRECREELGIEVKVRAFIPHIFSWMRGNAWHGILFCFVCDVADNARITLNCEASEYGWFTLKEIRNLKALTNTQDISEHAHKVIHHIL